jgi:hypothetical protein
MPDTLPLGAPTIAGAMARRCPRPWKTQPRRLLGAACRPLLVLLQFACGHLAHGARASGGSTRARRTRTSTWKACELVILQQRHSDGQVKAQIKDARTGMLIRSIVF